MSRPRCVGCEKCQTTLAGRPSLHAALEPHAWRDSYDERTGQVSGRVCEECGEYAALETAAV